MLEPYWGEFLISPIPLELSLHYCSHKCAYCFANLNDPKRKGDVQAIMRLLTDFQNRDTLTARLLQEKYPVCISNRTDPFATANYRQTLPILEMLTALGIPVTIQTKGGFGTAEALDILPPSVWYISISMVDEELRRKIEPGAPSIASRLALIEQVRAHGGRVILGLNPCVPEWLPDPEPMLRQAKAAGAEAVWIEELHLSAAQIANLSASERQALTEPLLARAKRRRRDMVDQAAFFAARDAAQGLGLPIFSNGQPNPSRIWEIYREVYPKTFPTNQDFVNQCHAQGLDGQVIGIETWLQAIQPWLPEGRYRMNKYIGAAAMSLFETHKIPSQLTYSELLGIIWAARRAKQSPVRMPSFAYAAALAETGWLQLVNEQGAPYLVFDQSGSFETYFTQAVMTWQQPVDIG